MIDIILTLNEIDVEDYPQIGYMTKTFRGKTVSLIDQAEILIKSIKKNWHFPNKIFVFHSLPMSYNARDRLRTAGAKVLRQQHDIASFGAIENRITALICKPSVNSTHRLILDVDMIALENLELDLDQDAMVGLSGYNVLPEKDWRYICMVCGVDMPMGKILDVPESPWREYAHGNRGYFPCFNAGPLMISNAFVATIVDKVIDYMILVKGSSLSDFIRGTFAYTIAVSLAIVKYTDNWCLFPAGVNFLLPLLSPNEYHGKIYLLHYLSKERPALAEYYSEYFTHLSNS